MKYQDIRAAFPGCDLAVTGDGIYILFPAYSPPRLVEQDVNEEEFGNKRLLEQLIHDCDEVIISVSPDVPTVLHFSMALPVEHDLVFRKLKQKPDDVSLRDPIETMLAERGVPDGFVNVLKAADAGDGDKVLSGLRELCNEINRGAVYNISRTQNWPPLVECFRALTSSLGFGATEEEAPDEFSDFGVADLLLSAAVRQKYSFNGENKEKLENLVEMSTTVGIESYISDDDADFTLSFYS